MEVYIGVHGVYIGVHEVYMRGDSRVPAAISVRGVCRQNVRASAATASTSPLISVTMATAEVATTATPTAMSKSAGSVPPNPLPWRPPHDAARWARAVTTKWLLLVRKALHLLPLGGWVGKGGRWWEREC